MSKSARSPRTGRAGFLGAWDRLLGPYRPTVPKRPGRPPRVSLQDLLAALTFHVMQPAGTLGQHFDQLFEDALSDSACADRRQRLPWQVFADLMRHVLRPRAQPRRNPEAFWRGWRLLGLDGTQFSVQNTPAVTLTLRKARTRRGRAAFAKLTTTVLLELGAHNPLAAGIGRHGESEWALAIRLLAQLPRRSLLLADRLYGVASFALQAGEVCQRVGSHLLLRARGDVTRRVVHRLPDGTCRVRLVARDPRRRSRILGQIELREIRAQIRRPGRRPHPLRLWTTLLDPATAPALDLATLYAQRWEHELYFRELKRHLHRGPLLQSHTVETAAQEVAAMILTSAVVADERLRVARGHAPVLRVSFSAVLDVTRGMWFTVQLFDDLLTPRQLQTALRRGYRQLRQCLVPRRPGRSCLRALRQPIRAWPRLRHTRSVTAPFQVALVR